MDNGNRKSYSIVALHEAIFTDNVLYLMIKWIDARLLGSHMGVQMACKRARIWIAVVHTGEI